MQHRRVGLQRLRAVTGDLDAAQDRDAELTTRISGGTVISRPPRTQKARIVTSWPGRTASRKSSSAPPSTVSTSISGSACQRPLRVAPPSTATIRLPAFSVRGRRAGARRDRGRRAARQVGQQRRDIGVRLGRVDRVQPVRMLLGGQAAFRQGVVNDRRGAVTFGVRGTQPRNLVEARGVHPAILGHASRLAERGFDGPCRGGTSARMPCRTAGCCSTTSRSGSARVPPSRWSARTAPARPR